MPVDQGFFELQDIQPLDRRPWIVLRQVTDETFDVIETGLVKVEQYVGTGTAAIETAHRAQADKLGWSDLDVGNHRSGVEAWGYSAADIFRDWKTPLGINLVVDQFLEGESEHVWHLHPDLVVALGLKRENDSWFRPEEGWIEVVRLKRDDDGAPTVMEIRKEFLADYLCARGMALYCSSYIERTAITDRDPGYRWATTPVEEELGRDKREIYTVDAGWPHAKGHFRTMGALWRTEWIEPGTVSTRVRGDPDPQTVTFAVDADGTRSSPDDLQRSGTYLYFNPGIVSALLRYRGGHLRWFTAETGGLGATASGIHFGVNALGLINILAKDINRIDAWEQRIWAAHNVTPEGGVSRELFEAQMEVNPADTKAPEAALGTAIQALEDAFAKQYASQLLREHESIEGLLRKTHRFVATEPDGLLQLAKDITRLFIERVENDSLFTALGLTKAKLGSLKLLEKLVASRLSEDVASKMMAPLFGIYDLRLADAHLGSSKIASGLKRAGVDDTLPHAMQGRQLLQSTIDTLHAIMQAIK